MWPGGGWQQSVGQTGGADTEQVWGSPVWSPDEQGNTEGLGEERVPALPTACCPRPQGPSILDLPLATAVPGAENQLPRRPMGKTAWNQTQGPAGQLCRVQRLCKQSLHWRNSPSWGGVPLAPEVPQSCAVPLPNPFCWGTSEARVPLLTMCSHKQHSGGVSGLPASPGRCRSPPGRGAARRLGEPGPGQRVSPGALPPLAPRGPGQALWPLEEPSYRPAGDPRKTEMKVMV